tara:strand:+ start:210 stop:533 length:324 start_codon:yes stop_codon:yes gene_type:complete
MKQNDKPLFPEPVFPEGIYYNLPHENAPNFVKGTLSINVEKMKVFLDSLPEDTLRLDCLESKKGRGYLKIVKMDKKYSYKEQEVKEQEPLEKSFYTSENTKEDDLPF